MLAAVENDLEVEAVPGLAGEELLQVALSLDDVFSGGEFPAGGEAVDVRVYGKCRDAEGLGHDDGGGFVTDAGQGLERGEIRRDLAGVLFHQNFR